MTVTLSWLDPADPPYDALTELVQAVAATGGAVGWLRVPPPREVHAWVDGLSGQRTVLAHDGDRLVGEAPTYRGEGKAFL